MAIPKPKPKRQSPHARWREMAEATRPETRYFFEYAHPDTDESVAHSRPEAAERLDELSAIRRQGPLQARRISQPIPRNEPTAQGDQVPKYFPEKRGFGYMAARTVPDLNRRPRGKFTAEDWKAADADPSLLTRRDVSLERVFEGKYSPEGLKGAKRGTKMSKEDTARMLMKRKIMERGRQWVADQVPLREAQARKINERRLRAILVGEHPDFAPKPGLMLPEFIRGGRVPDIKDLDMRLEMPEKRLRYTPG